jgi:hypothetical protein
MKDKEERTSVRVAYRVLLRFGHYGNGRGVDPADVECGFMSRSSSLDARRG